MKHAFRKIIMHTINVMAVSDSTVELGVETDTDAVDEWGDVKAELKDIW